ncbi:MAG: sigma 54-interacting transcriptional regulator [Firmicutes bacterium]|nr:sigma 54-interacting transcriptional regulator [Bacillota bacterium]
MSSPREKPTLLLVSRSLQQSASLQTGLAEDFEVVVACEKQSMLEQLEAERPELVALDQEEQNPEFIALLAPHYPRLGIFVIPSHPCEEEHWYQSHLEEIRGSLKAMLSLVRGNEGVDRLRSELKRRYGFGNLTSNNVRMQEIFHSLSKVVDTGATVLIQGESGTGKELIAKAIHYNSQRREGPFIKVNCAAIPESLLESELFGHEKGAFTGADHRVLGKFELASDGTIFLDEIGDMSPATQSKILRVLQEREIERVGGQKTITVDVRVVAATNKNLADAVAREVFRSDLFYRLNVFPIALPPLRERREDIPFLVSYFLRKFNEEFGKDIHGVSSQVLDLFLLYEWPGNIRQLENAVKRAVILAEDRRPLDLGHLPAEILQTGPRESGNARLSLRESAKQTVMGLEKQAVMEAVRRTGWNVSKAARELGVTRRTLYKKLERYNMSRPTSA